jgi:GT2 family glycosyltransferase
MKVFSEANIASGSATMTKPGQVKVSKLCIITVGYAESRETALEEFETFISQLARGSTSVEFIYFDNKSWFEEKSQGAYKYIPSPDGNIGFARAVNLARRHTSAERLLLLNSDLVLSPGQLKEIIQTQLSLGSMTVWAPQLINEDGTYQTWEKSLHSNFALEEVCGILGYPRPFKDHPKRKYYLRGAVWSVSRKLFDFQNGFDEKFFLFGEEADFCFRLPLEANLVFDSSIKIVHKGSQGAKSKSMFAYRHALRGRLLLQLRYNGLWATLIVAPFAAAAYAKEFLKRLLVAKP